MTTATSSTKDSTSRQDASEALGALLARARQARGLEQREAAARLGLSLDVVRALEEGNAQQVDAPVFVRGYLLRYARFLGLPEQEILERYRSLGINEQPPLRLASAAPRPTGGHAASRWFAYLLLAGLLGWIAWVGLEQAGRQTADAPPAAEVKPPASATPSPVAPPATEPASGAGGQDSNTVTATAPPAAAPVNPSPAQPSMAGPPRDSVVASAPLAPPPAASAPTPTAAGPAAGAPPTLPPGHAELVLEFKGDSWVSIRDADGQRLAYQTGKANSTSTFSGRAPFRVVLGNSGAVTIRLNGQTIDPTVYVKRTGPSQFVLESKPGA